MALKEFFIVHDIKGARIFLFASITFLFGTIYCKITFDLNKGTILCLYFNLLTFKKYKLSINTIESITANIIRIHPHGYNYATSLEIRTNSQEKKTLSLQLGTHKDKLRKSVELMNSLVIQYLIDHDTGK
jgi:hypothetical protein